MAVSFPGYSEPWISAFRLSIKQDKLCVPISSFLVKKKVVKSLSEGLEIIGHMTTYYYSHQKA